MFSFLRRSYNIITGRSFRTASHIVKRLNTTGVDEEEKEVRRWNKVLTTHMRNGQYVLARSLFDKMCSRNSVTYNVMISGYISNNRLDLALLLFNNAPVNSYDVVTYNIVLNGFVKNHNLSAALYLFDKMVYRDVVTWNTMISAYALNGLVKEAQEMFDKAPVKNNISWNGLLAAYLQNNHFTSAVKLFESNPEWELVSWNAMLAGYSRRKLMKEARSLFDKMPCRDNITLNTMITGYAQSGDLKSAEALFNITPSKDVYTWTGMISCYSQNNQIESARGIFDMMPRRNTTSWNAMIFAYIQNHDLVNAKSLFDQMERDQMTTTTYNILLTGLLQAGEIDSGRALFAQIPQTDSVSFSAMIAGFSQAGLTEEAMKMFVRMRRTGPPVRLNRSTMACMLATCGDVAMLEVGKQVHGALVRTGFMKGCFVENALIAMYSKCGVIEDAYVAFCGVEERDVVTWNTIICGFSRHGFGKEALNVFAMMTSVSNSTKPDDVTMVNFYFYFIFFYLSSSGVFLISLLQIAVLSACSHAGMIDAGTNYFYTMQKTYGLNPKPEHYTCMIDLLGRAGRLTEAERLIETAPFDPDSTMWGALLGACRKYNNTKLGEKAALEAFRLEPDNAGMYVLLSNLYASSGKWSNAGELRILMRDRGVKKVPGFSWIEVDNKVHVFSVGDSLHPETEKIYWFLEELGLKLKKAGFVSSPKLVLHDVEEEEKEEMLKHHSERLAVVYGIMNVPKGRPIRVMKNIRVCEDCHTAIKHISKIEDRLIVLRDSNRFHHFKDGSCSCADYW